MSTFQLIRRYVPYLAAVRGRLAACVALRLITPLSGVLLLLLVKSLIDQVLVSDRIERLPLYLGGYAVLMGASIVLDHVLTRLDSATSEQITLEIRADLYAHLLKLSPGSMKRSVGELLSHMSSDIGRAEYLIYSGPLGAFSNMARVAFFSCFLFLLSPKLTLCALLVIPFYALASRRASPRVRRAARLSRRFTTGWMSLAEEGLAAGPLVHAFDAHAREAGRFRARAELARRAALKGVALQAALGSTIEAIGAIAGLLAILVGALQIHAHALSVGALIAFLGSVGSLYGPARSLARAWSRFQRAGAGAQRVSDLLDTPSLVTERAGARRLGHIRGALEFRGVRFAYPRGPEVLSGVSFAAEPGETVAIVGASGSGKSTLVGLALRLYDPQAGNVLVDGQDLRELTLESVRRAVCPVFQEPYLFRGSVAENVRYGAPEACSDDVAAAVRAANAEAFVRALPAGLTSLVGPRGSWLSGGQRQRLALARAFLRDAPILILDEATAALDSETEAFIQDALSRLHGRRTLLVVAHRLASVQRADRVLVLDQGRIVESGSPQALLSGLTRCRQLFAAQLSGPRAAA